MFSKVISIVAGEEEDLQRTRGVGEGGGTREREREGGRERGREREGGRERQREELHVVSGLQMRRLRHGLYGLHGLHGSAGFVPAVARTRTVLLSTPSSSMPATMAPIISSKSIREADRFCQPMSSRQA